jgi:hypothetical protein
MSCLLRRIAPLIFAATLLGTKMASAEDRALVGIEVRIDCSALGAEAKNVLEARARADLQVRGVSQGSLGITCTSLDVTLTFDAARRHHSRSLPREALSIDALLAALDELAGDAREERSLALAGQESLAAVLPTQPPSPRRTSRRTLSARAAVRVEAWGTSAFATGPRADVLVGIGRVDVLAGVGAGFAAGALHGLSADLIDVVLGAEFRFGPKDLLRVGAGVLGGFFRVHAPAALSPSAANRTTPGLWLGARAALPLGPVVLSFAPDLRGYVRPKTVNVDASKVFGLPPVAPGASIAIEVGF